MPGSDFRLARTQALPLVADPAPNTTPPAAASLLELSTEPPGVQNSNPSGVSLYFEGFTGATPVSPGTVTYELWVRDEATQRFVGPVLTGAAVADRAMQSVKVPPGAKLFARVTAVGGFAGATSLVTRAVESFI